VTPRALLLTAAALAALWTSGILIVPLIEGQGGFAATAAGLARFLYRPVCHQMSERSLAIDARCLTVCARCTGLYLGGTLGLLLMAVGYGRLRPPERVWLLVAVIPTGVDFAMGHLIGVSLPNLARMIVAIPAGLMLGIYLAIGLADLARPKRQDARDPSLETAEPIATPDRLHVGG
jgi:uncharacterized membrane protein